jgi:hypothetical protein
MAGRVIEETGNRTRQWRFHVRRMGLFAKEQCSRNLVEKIVGRPEQALEI